MNETQKKTVSKIVAVVGFCGIFGVAMMAINPNNPVLVDLGRLAMFIVSAHIYFIPSFVVHFRGHHQMMPIFLINMFLGWSLIGWVAALPLLLWITRRQRRPAR